jgi:hypothetical protein
MISLPLLGQRSKSKTEEIIAPVAVFEGVIYSLPRTGINITIEAKQTVFAPGPYAIFGESLLGIQELKTKPQKRWEIEKVTIDTYAEPDPVQFYKTIAIASSSIQLTQDGCLAGINCKSPVGKFIPVITNSMVVKSKDENLVFPYMIDNPTLSGRTPVEQRAAEAAGRILKARSQRYEIAAGMLDEFHPDGKAYEESFRELRQIEKDNLELFTGKSTSETYTYTFCFIPSSEGVKGEVLFRFDENLGVLQKNDFSGVAFMVDIEKDNSFKDNFSDPVKDLLPGSDKTGIYYRQPGMGNIRLVKELTVIATSRVPVAQFGYVKQLPAELLTGSNCIEFHPETGAIKSILQK